MTNQSSFSRSLTRKLFLNWHDEWYKGKQEAADERESERESPEAVKW